VAENSTVIDFATHTDGRSCLKNKDYEVVRALAASFARLHLVTSKV